MSSNLSVIPTGYQGGPGAMWIGEDLSVSPYVGAQSQAVTVDLRNQAGIASGSGSVADGIWLRGTNGNAGVFPQQIADQLSGQSFNSFQDFRQAFWQAVASDPDLSAQFSSSNLSRMSQGLAPYAPSSQQVGGSMSYILHHIEPLQYGGELYGMNNLMIVTPRYHIEVLDPNYHF